MFKSKFILYGIIFATAAASQASRAADTDILPALRPTVSEVVKNFAQIPPDRQLELKKVALYIKTQGDSNQQALVTFICTHNSRRSIMSQAWAQAAASYYGIPYVKVYSGGIEVDACNIRTVNALRRAGFAIDGTDTGKNPVYLIRYSAAADPIRAFSKLYDKDGNPTEKYVAVMTCSNADKNCPVVEGSSMRVPLHYEDPKDSDGTPGEDAAYDERCKQIATEMLYLMSLVKQ